MTLDNNGKRVPQNGPVRVAQKEKNAWGLYDMLGNVFQFTGDRYGANYYQQKEERDPTGAAGGESRSLRGRGISEVSLRISFRVGRDPEVASEDTGFRCIFQ
jgi:formylglycine-generating enzyme required for sulfatase activity